MDENYQQIFDLVKDKFGETGAWQMILLLPFIDMKSWTFPDYVKETPMKDLAEFIEQNEIMKSMFKSLQS